MTSGVNKDKFIKKGPGQSRTTLFDPEGRWSTRRKAMSAFTLTHRDKLPHTQSSFLNINQHGPQPEMAKISKPASKTVSTTEHKSPFFTSATSFDGIGVSGGAGDNNQNQNRTTTAKDIQSANLGHENDRDYGKSESLEKVKKVRATVSCHSLKSWKSKPPLQPHPHRAKVPRVPQSETRQSFALIQNRPCVSEKEFKKSYSVSSKLLRGESSFNHGERWNSNSAAARKSCSWSGGLTSNKIINPEQKSKSSGNQVKVKNERVTHPIRKNNKQQQGKNPNDHNDYERRGESNRDNYERDSNNTMRTARSEHSLLEQKRLQWAKEREELNGLWTPWGRQTELTSSSLSKSKSSNSFSPSTSNSRNQQHPQNMQAPPTYASPTNVVSSSYMANLGMASSTYSQSSHSECYLPPINSTIAQQPRQKAKVWNAEFQTEDYRYENGTPQQRCSSINSGVPGGVRAGVVHPTPSSRKGSLPNYMVENGGDNYHNNNYHHQQMVHHQQTKLNRVAATARNNTPNNELLYAAAVGEEDAFTSGYYSSGENNNDVGGVGESKQDQVAAVTATILKPCSRERSYQEEITVQKAIAIRGGGGGDASGESPRVFMHKMYAQNGEVFAEHDHDDNQEELGEDEETQLIPNVSSPTNNGLGNGVRQYVNSYSKNGELETSGRGLPRNHAMRSSLTIGVDASHADAYNDFDRREKEQWLSELEKQREEQRMRKILEKEERRPRWGDRGIGVGHFWEPSDSENSHLPAPPHRGSKGGSTLNRGESVGNGGGSGGSGSESYASPPHPSYHPGQSHTPPAWLERSLTRMQSSQSQPSLHDPEYTNTVPEGFEDGFSNGNGNGDGPHQNPHSHQQSHQLTSSRSLNQSAIDLRNMAGYYSPTNDPQSDRTFIRGQNVPIDLDTMSEREKKRLANQEHLEALKKQIEERQQMQKEEKERRLQEEREQEMRMAKQREMELQRLEMEKRGRIPVNGDMPNSVEDGGGSGVADNGSVKISTMMERAAMPQHDSTEERDIEIVQRQSEMVVRTPPEVGNDDTEKTGSESCTSINRMSRIDQAVMTDVDGDNTSRVYGSERTLTPSIQRSRSLSLLRSSREFGTQTELSDGSSTISTVDSSASGNSSCGSGKNSLKNRSHNSLLDKKAAKDKKEQEEKASIKEKMEKAAEKKTEERPRWGSNPIKKQYIKQSEKDPNYISRMKRRHERLKRMEQERSQQRADTGTESEDVSIPFHRIRQRRLQEVSPQRRAGGGGGGGGGGGIAPLKATHTFQTEETTETENNTKSKTVTITKNSQTAQKNRQNRLISKSFSSGSQEEPGDSAQEHSDDVPPLQSLKSPRSETHLNSGKTADILDRNFGSVAGINGLGTSEESSGFSTPFLLPRRRELDSSGSGGGSTGSGTTGSGSGIQSPDLIYHQNQNQNRPYKQTNQLKYGKITTMPTSGRDTVSTVNQATVITTPANNKKNNDNGKEFESPQKGFIHQKDFDEMPVKAAPSQSFSLDDVSTTANEDSPDQPSRSKFPPRVKNRTSSLPRSRKPPNNNKNNTNYKSKTNPRNASLSPQRKPRPAAAAAVPQVKVKNPETGKRTTLTNVDKAEIELDTDVTQDTTSMINQDELPEVGESETHQQRPESPPVPALLKKMQMGLQPDETGRMSSLPMEFPDILAPLPNIPIGVPLHSTGHVTGSRISSATSVASSGPKIDIDIAVTPRNNPEIIRLFEAAEERIRQRQLSAIIASRCNVNESDSAKSRTSFEADIGAISINLAPIMVYPGSGDEENPEHFQEAGENANFDIEIPLAPNSNARLNIRSHPHQSAQISPRVNNEAAAHEAFITSILNTKEVKEQLSARESELSEKGIIEFSIRLPSTSSGGEDFTDEYRDPLLSERRRHTAQWLYGGGGAGGVVGGHPNVPQKQAILTNLATLKNGITMQEQQQQVWKVANSDTE